MKLLKAFSILLFSCISRSTASFAALDAVFPTPTLYSPPEAGEAGAAQITAPPSRPIHRQLERRQIDLSFDDPSACNVGVCTPDSYCTVFAGDGEIDNPALGACCASTTSCFARTECVPFSSHTYGASGHVEDLTQFCPETSPVCIEEYYEYGYKLGLLKISLCVSSANPPTTYLNASWKLYSALGFSTKLLQPSASTTKAFSEDSSSSEKTSNGPSSSEQTDASSTEVPVGDLPDGVSGPNNPNNDSLAGEKDSGIGTGAIAGIAIGAAAVAGAIFGGIIWMVLRKRRVKADGAGQWGNPGAPHGLAGPPEQQPAPAYTGMATKVELPEATTYYKPNPTNELPG